MQGSYFKPNINSKQSSLNRREFLVAGSSVLASFSQLAAQSSGEPSKPFLGQRVKSIETKICMLRLDSETGDLVGIHWKNPAADTASMPDR